MKNKKLFISLTAVAAVVLFLGIFILMWFVGDTYKDFERFRKEFAIEGLDDGAIPQGLGAYFASYPESFDEDGKPATNESATSVISKQQQYFLQSAYMKDGSPSRIYVTGSEDGYLGYVTMLNEDGTPHTGHVGGVATNGTRLWVTYGKKVLVAKANSEYIQNINKENRELYSLKCDTLAETVLVEIIDKAIKNNSLPDDEKLTVQFTASFNANCNAAYLYYFDDPSYGTQSYDRLYVGEFYRKGNYETDKSHRLVTPTGYKNTSFMYEYRVNTNNTNKYGLELIDSRADNDVDPMLSDNVPKIQKIYSLPEKIQGIAFSKRSSYGTNSGILVLSQSYGLANSHLLCFDWKNLNAKGTKYTELNEEKTPFVYDGVYRVHGDKSTPFTDSSLQVYYADKGDSNIFVKDYSVPSMTEGLCTTAVSGSSNPSQNRVYVLFESGSKKYNMFTRESIKNVYSFIPNV